MTRTEAYQMLTLHLKNPNLIKHSFAAESAMIGICKYLYKGAEQSTIDKWAIAGLLHDADYEETYNHPEKHGIVATEKIALPDDVAHAIRAHNYKQNAVLPESDMDWAIATCDQLTGLIVAATLISPAKKINQISPEFVLKRFYEKGFAKGCDRKSIQECEEKLNIPLIKYIEITLNSMKGIADTLKL